MQSPSNELRNGGRLTSVALAVPEHLLLRHPLLLGAREEMLASLLARIPIQRAAKGTLLNDPRISGGFLHLVLLGCLKAYQVNADGDELLFEVIDVGGIDGLLPASGLRGHFQEAAEDSLLALITVRTLERMIAAEPRVASNFIGLISARLAARESQLQSLTLQDPERRLASLLLGMGEATGSSHRSVTTARRLSHEMLGNMLDMRAIAVGVHLRRFVEVGAVFVTDECFRLDVCALRRVIDGTAPPSPRSA